MPTFDWLTALLTRDGRATAHLSPDMKRMCEIIDHLRCKIERLEDDIEALKAKTKRNSRKSKICLRSLWNRKGNEGLQIPADQR